MLLFIAFFPFFRAVVVVSLYRQKQVTVDFILMATLEVVEETLVNLYNQHKENHSEMGDISQFVKSLGLSSVSPNFDSGLKGSYQNNTFNPKSSYASKSCTASTQQMASAEIMAQTLGVLAHLKTSRTQFFDLDNIPALQNQEWNQICDLAKYLLNKKFVTVKGIETKLFAQITQLGLQFLHACEATAC